MPAMLLRRALALFAMIALGGCASSPYDSAWVNGEVGRKTGHAVPERAAPGVGGEPSFRPSLPPGIASASALSEDDAVSVALWNSARFRADLAQLGFSRADLADAAALPNPNLAFLFPMSTRQAELSITYPVTSLLQRKWRVAAAKLDVERVARGLVQSGVDYVRDVRIAWAELAGAEQRRELRARMAELSKKSTELATGRFQSGDVSALEADMIRGDWLATLDLDKRSLHETEIARARLRLLLGLGESPLGARVGVRAGDLVITPPPSLDRLESVALAARPDVRAGEIAIEAAGERIGLERAKILQAMARLDAKPVGSAGGPPVLWLPGVQADIPIFNQNQGGRARAHAELDRASWSYVEIRAQVLTDVRLAREEVVLAVDSLEPYRASIVPLQERNVAAAMRAYETGAEAYLVVLDATRQLAIAKLREIDLALDLRRARARLDRAIGWRIDASR